MRHLFLQNLKRKLINPLSVISIIVLLSGFILSYFLKNRQILNQYVEACTGKLTNPIEVSNTLYLRLLQREKHYLEPALFNMYKIFSSGSIYFNYIMHFLCILPAISFFNDKKNGVVKNVLSRTNLNNLITIESFSTFSAVFTIAFIPQFIVWLIAVIIFPSNLGNDIQHFVYIYGVSLPDDAFYFLHNFDWIRIYYLIYILVISIYFALLGVIVLLLAAIIRKKVFLYFIPLTYYFFMVSVSNLLSLQAYFPVPYLEAGSSYTSIFMPLFILIIICWVIKVNITMEDIIDV
jgi:hypothetical protein